MNKKGNVFWVGLCLVIFIIAFLFIGSKFINVMWKDYKFNQGIGDYCKLSYEASDIHKKIEYFDECVSLLEEENLDGHAVWWFKKPINKLSEAYEVMYSLQERLHNLDTMEKDSFEYQTGLAQVEEELGYFIGRSEFEGDALRTSTLDLFSRKWCFENTWTKYWC